MILSLIIQLIMKSTYNKYSKIPNTKGMTGADIARSILRSAGIYDIDVQMTSGQLSDHFDPTKKVIKLSNEVFCANSISAIGVAAHETGHALQYASDYFPMRLRSSIVGITNFSSKLLYFLIILSFVFSIPIICDIAVICFGVLFFFQVVTLPVEFNASSRAIEQIEALGYESIEISSVKKVLTAAAMTYVVAMLYSLGQLATFFLRTRNRRR